VQRLRREAENVAALDHPHIVPVYEVGEHDGQAFFSMKLVDGGNLPLSRPNASSLRDAAKLVATIARAVHHAHQRGVLHRDLKPANVLLDNEGEPHVSDFGLAKRLDGVNDHTLSGALVGTPSYMAPEQAAGQKGLTTAADIYGLGAILYERLTGRPPFQAATPLDTMRQVLSDEPVRPRRLQPRVPRDLETICLKCLRKEPERRYASAQALAEDLDRFLKGEPVQARPVAAWQRMMLWVRRRPAIAALTALCLLVTAVGFGLVTWLWLDAEDAREDERYSRTVALKEAAAARHSQKEADAAREDAERALQKVRHSHYLSQVFQAAEQLGQGGDGVAGGILDGCPWDLCGWEWHYLRHAARVDRQGLTLRGRAGNVTALAFSPDGARLASGEEVSADKQAKGLPALVRVWDTATGRQMLAMRGHTHTILQLAYSADGKRLLSLSKDGTVKAWDAAGKEIDSFRTGAIPECAVLSPDGARLARAAGNVLIVRALASGRDLLTLSCPGLRGFALAFSPDGNRLAGVVGNQVRIWDSTSGKELLTIAGHNPDVQALAFSHTGQYLAAALGTSVRVWDTRTGERILHRQAYRGDAWCLSFCADGTRLAVADGNTVIIWDVATGADQMSFRSPPEVSNATFDCLAFSPAGGQLAAAAKDTIRIWGAVAGSEPFVLRDAAPCVAFSPDGKYLAAPPEESIGTLNVWNASTGQLTLSPATPHGQVWAPVVAFSPDSKWVAGCAGSRVLAFDLKTGAEAFSFPVSEGTTKVLFNPAGGQIATLSERLTPNGLLLSVEICTWDVGTGRQLVRFDKPAGGVKDLAYSPDGRHLAGASRDQVIVWDTATGRVVRRIKGHRVAVEGIAYSPDGRRLATASAYESVRLWDASTGQQLLCLSGNDHPFVDTIFTCVAFSPDGRLLAAGHDTCVRVWDAASGQELFSLRYEPIPRPALGLAFSPDGRRLAAVLAGRVLVWDLSLSASVRRALQTRSLVASYFQRFLLREQVLANLPRADGLTKSERAAALQLAQEYPEDAEALNRHSWALVKSPEGAAAVYQRALRCAEAASRLAPRESLFRITLGAALFRVGEYAQARDALVPFDEVHASGQPIFPWALPFLTMAQHRLGQTAEARATLARLHKALKDEGRASDRELRQALWEAEAVIGPAPR
jgi:WD40 repeat protein